LRAVGPRDLNEGGASRLGRILHETQHFEVAVGWVSQVLDPTYGSNGISLYRRD
jgi:hypothetical protein